MYDMFNNYCIGNNAPQYSHKVAKRPPTRTTSAAFVPYIRAPR